MPEISFTRNNITPGLVVFSWAAILPADTGMPVALNGGFPLSGSIQVIGTFGGATISLEGSNNGTDWVPLRDVNNALISLGATGMLDFSVACLSIRPAITGGTGSSLTVLICLRG